MYGSCLVNPPRHLRSLLFLASLVALAAPRPSHGQGTASLVLIGLDPATGTLVPVGMELVRRPGELRLDPQAGTLTVIGPMPEPAGPAALLAFEPTTRTLVAVDLRPVRRPGEFTLDPRTGALTAEGLVTPYPAVGAEGPALIGLDSGTGRLVPMDVGLERESGSYAIDPRAGILSPPPRGPALLGFDPTTGSLVLVRLAPIRGQGAFSVDPGTRLLSRMGAPSGAAQAAAPLLLGTRSDAGGLLAVDLDLAYRGAVLAIDPSTGVLLPPRQEAAQAVRSDDLTNLGAHSFTGALSRVEVEPVLKPGEYAVDLPSGTLSLVTPPEPPARGTEGVVLGAGLDVRQMLKLGDVLQEIPGAAEADATKLAPGVHGFVEYAWRAISLGIEAAYSVMDTEVMFPQGLQTGDLSYREIGGNAKVTVPLGSSAWPYATFAILRSWSKADFEIEGLSEERTHKTTRAGIGGGLDYWVRPHWGLRVEALYSTTFEDSDAGEHIRWRFGAMYSPRGLGTGRYVD